MAIAPVSMVSNRINNVNFEGRKKDTASNYNTPVKISKVSVPVALLMAMSPLNTIKANPVSEDKNIDKIEVSSPDMSLPKDDPVVLFNKTFDVNDPIDHKDIYKMKIVALSFDNNNENFESVYAVPIINGKEDINVLPVEYMENSNIYINFNNGNKLGPISYSLITIPEPYGLFSTTVIDPLITGTIKALAKHEGNNAGLTVKNYTYNLYLDDFVFTKDKPCAKPENIDGFGILLETKNIKGSEGNYKLRVYSKNKEKIMTLQKENEKETEFIKTGDLSFSIKPTLGEEVSGTLTNIIVTKKDNFVDDNLSIFIRNLSQKPEYSFLKNKICKESFNYGVSEIRDNI